MRSAPALLTLSLLALAGCTTDNGKYPSLLPRPIESQSLAEPAVPTSDTGAVAADPALDAKIAAITATLDKTARDFTTASRSAEAAVAVARGVPEGSESWLNAQVALSDLQTAHAPALAALADLEQLAIERGESGLAAYPALEAATARASEMVQSQGATITGLENALKGG